jgi:putative DNA primase/helicase
MSFLDKITGGDNELIRFLQRMAGYTLTGMTTEHALFFLYGTGANGKSTFINAVTGCAGDYHRVAPIETFTASKEERHPTDLAGLRGARLVTSVETEEGRRWAESKIKALTGGDKISARFMKQDFFDFTPTFKLVIAGNHRPGLRSVDEAIRRRFHLVPFGVTVPLDERDKDLPDKLKAEAPGILWWMIQGCLEWQRTGLAPPESVRAATDAYLDSEDVLAAWIDDVGKLDPDGWHTTGELYRSYEAWAKRNGEWVGSIKKFSQRLEDRAGSLGMRRQRGADGKRGFRGLRLSQGSLNG